MAPARSSKPPSPNRRVGIEQLVELLAPALGREKSQDLIAARAKTLGHTPERLNLEQSLEVLDALGAEPGIVGVAARFAAARLTTPEKSRGESQPSQTKPTAQSEQGGAPLASATIEPDQLAALLAHSIGTEKSREVVDSALAQLDITARSLNSQQAHAVLEFCAKLEGIIGVTARFAKARLILQLKRQ